MSYPDIAGMNLADHLAQRESVPRIQPVSPADRQASQRPVRAKCRSSSDEQIVPETVDHPVVKPKHPSALAALNMAMVVFGQVVDGGAVTQVDVLYQSQVAQGSQRSVDGGQVEFRVVALEALGELFGTDVSLGIVGQLGQYQPPRRRHAPAAPTQVVQ